MAIVGEYIVALALQVALDDLQSELPPLLKQPVDDIADFLAELRVFLEHLVEDLGGYDA